MSNSTHFVTDEEKINPDAFTLYDRVINLKITCREIKADGTLSDTPDEYVLRSDYEMVIPDASNMVGLDGTAFNALKGEYVIRRCTKKPSIKVQMKMVSANTGIEVSIFITNFFMLSKDGKHLLGLSASRYNIEKVEIAMGYWGQFRIGKESALEVPSYDEFFEIKAQHGADKLTLTGAITARTEKLPPDSVICISGKCADIYSAPVAVSDLLEGADFIDNPVAKSNDSMETIAKTFFTKRYLNINRVTDTDYKMYGGKYVQISDIKSFPVKVTFDTKTGLLVDSDAEKYGVKVYLSSGAKALKLPTYINNKGEEVEKDFYCEAGWTMENTVARLASFLDAKLDYTFTREGDLILYTPEEAKYPSRLWEDLDGQKLYDNSVLGNATLYDGKLPAVNNINIDVKATITCPFFTFFQPFQKFQFATRFALTSDVSYWADYDNKIFNFYAISASISFATEDNDNEVQIIALSEPQESK